MAGAKLPYDAEVEYIEATGTQCINIGNQFHRDVTGGGVTVWGCVCAARMMWTHVPTSCEVLCGAQHYTTQQGMNSARYSPLTSAYNTPSKWGRAEKAGWVDTNIGIVAGEIVQANGQLSSVASFLRVGSQTSYKNDNFFWGDGTTHAPMAVFARTVIGSSGLSYSFFAHARLYYLIIYTPTSGTVVHRYIPVRVGTVGYLYDEINPTGGPNGNGLYGNALTGDFILGQDRGSGRNRR